MRGSNAPSLQTSGREDSLLWVSHTEATEAEIFLPEKTLPGSKTHLSVSGTTGETGFSELLVVDPSYRLYKVVLCLPAMLFTAPVKKSLAYFFVLKDTKKPIFKR